MKNKHHFECITKRKYGYSNRRTNLLNLYMNILFKHILVKTFIQTNDYTDM